MGPLQKFSMKSTITKTEDMFDFIHSNYRASKKWVTLTKTFRC